ncbi:DUF748 domain-containing protein [Aequorivita sp. H23M31]|uniref:DUF748 domain-containing protein n=1 Tax=Aequorivita ciconiae TaxID=2494375 RepID=A0A410G0J0_9FLAO|nr:DUF748 domain-containing protein [Aequorivita sp. H23M31]QAA80787.1 DUF748 domain-containing protein [Aequorivita sp. H23M31]
MINCIMSEGKKPINYSKAKWFKRKRYYIPAIILHLFIAFRLFLPFWIENKVNKTLAELPGYQGQVSDIDVSIFNGTYSIKGMTLKKDSAKTEIPYIKLPHILIAFDWEALKEGKLASKIQIQNAELTYVLEDWKDIDNKTQTKDWKNVWTKLVPLDINQIEIHSGKVLFIPSSLHPEKFLGLQDLTLSATNLQSVIEKERILPSPIEVNGISNGNGKFHLEGNMNLQKEIPEMDLSFSLENADIEALNSFTSTYGGFYFAKGKMDIMGEADISKANFKGYIKPIINNSEVIKTEDDFTENLWQGFVLLFSDILKHTGSEPLTTKISVETGLGHSEMGTWATIIDSFNQSWIQVFNEKIIAENTVKKTPLSRKELQKQLQEQKAKRKKELRPKKG